MATCTGFSRANPASHSLRKLKKHQVDYLLDLIEVSFPGLSDQLKGLSELLSFFIEHGRLPPYTLRLELLSKDQLESMRFKEWSLQELLEPCGKRGGEHPADDPSISSHCLTEDNWPSPHMPCAFGDLPPDSISSQPVSLASTSERTEHFTDFVSMDLLTLDSEPSSRTDLLSDDIYKKPADFTLNLHIDNTDQASHLENIYLLSPTLLSSHDLETHSN